MGSLKAYAKLEVSHKMTAKIMYRHFCEVSCYGHFLLGTLSLQAILKSTHLKLNPISIDIFGTS